MSGVPRSVKVGLSRLRRYVALARAVVRGLFVHHAFDHAATMAFYFFLGAIPLLVFAGALVGHFLAHDASGPLVLPLDLVMSGPAAEQLRKELVGLAAATGAPVAPLSVLGFLWLTSNGFHNLMDVFELLVGARQRSWRRQRLMAVGWVAATLTIAVAATWALLEVNGALDAIRTAAPGPGFLGRARHGLAGGLVQLDVIVVLLTLCTLALAVFYRFSVEHPPVIRRRVWPGTFAAMTLWTLVSWAFGTWVSTLGHYTVYYGPMATVAIVLLWLYLTSLALLVGAEINARLEGVGNRTLIPL